MTDHGEQHRKREVRVVDGALLAANTMNRIGFAILLLGFHQLALTGNDHEKDVRHHHRAERGTELNEGASPAEQVT